MLATARMTTRIEARFARCRAENRAALVTYVMAGDPDPETSLAMLKALPKAGADIVELGLPFTDPMADGPAIQAAGLRALKAGQTTGEDARARAPLPRGRRRHARDPDGLLQPDLRLRGRALPRRREERRRRRADRRRPAARGGRRALPAGARRPASPSSASRRRRPTTSACRRCSRTRPASSTTSRSPASPAPRRRISRRVSEAVARIKRHTPLPVVVGFGVKTAAHAAAIAQGRRRRGGRLGARRRGAGARSTPRATRPRKQSIAVTLVAELRPACARSRRPRRRSPTTSWPALSRSRPTLRAEDDGSRDDR